MKPIFLIPRSLNRKRNPNPRCSGNVTQNQSLPSPRRSVRTDRQVGSVPTVHATESTVCGFPQRYPVVPSLIESFSSSFSRLLFFEFHRPDFSNACLSKNSICEFTLRKSSSAQRRSASSVSGCKRSRNDSLLDTSPLTFP